MSRWISMELLFSPGNHGTTLFYRYAVFKPKSVITWYAEIAIKETDHAQSRLNGPSNLQK